MSTVTVQGWGPRQNALCPKAALACPRSAHSKRPLWGDSHSPPSFMTVMSFISAPSAMGQGALSTRPTGERGPRPSSTSTSALHCPPWPERDLSRPGDQEGWGQTGPVGVRGLPSIRASCLARLPTGRRGRRGPGPLPRG